MLQFFLTCYKVLQTKYNKNWMDGWIFFSKNQKHPASRYKLKCFFCTNVCINDSLWTYIDYQSIGLSSDTWQSCHRWGASLMKKPVRSSEDSSRGRFRSASVTWRWWTRSAGVPSSPSTSASFSSATDAGTARR